MQELHVVLWHSLKDFRPMNQGIEWKWGRNNSMFFISGRCKLAAGPFVFFKRKAYLFSTHGHPEISEDNKHFSTRMTQELLLKTTQQSCFKPGLAIMKWIFWLTILETHFSFQPNSTKLKLHEEKTGLYQRFSPGPKSTRSLLSPDLFREQS